MAGVLDGLKVLDLTSGIAGPMATMLLGDNGADVIKIEPPGGDPARKTEGPHRLGYTVWQRGKRSAFLDLTHVEDKKAFLALASTADILVESSVPGETAKLGIDYATLSAANPRLVYCSITGYGRDTAHSQRPAVDALVQARTGLMFEQRGWAEGALNHMNGLPDPFPDLEIPQDQVQGAPRPGPLFVASQWPSLGAFFTASLGIAAALRAREQTGRGQWVETSLMQGAFAGAAGVWQRAEKVDAAGFDTWILNSKSSKGHFQAKDGKWLHNWVPNPRFILQAAEGDTLNASPDLTVQNDPDRFGTGPEEILVMSHYQPILAEAVAKFPVKDWIEAAAVAEMTMQPVRSIEESLADPAFLEDGCVREVNDAELGTIRTVGNAFNMSLTQGKPGAAPVKPGANTAEVKAEAAKIIAEAKAAKPARDKKIKAPLDGIVVLDLGLAIAGPFGTQLLSDLGATVIKINGLFDLFWHRVHIAYMANRGKKSITLNLKDPRAMKILLDLVAKADVVQHNMRYDAGERLKIDYESLKKLNPKLIYAHSRGFERGVRAGLPGNDQTGACLSGIQFEDGGMGRGEGGHPMWSFTSFGDTGNGFLSATAICNAIYHRDRTGEGQFVDTSIINAALLNTSYAVAKPDGSGFARPRIDGMQLGFSAGHRLYETADGWICVALSTDAHWSALIGVLGLSADLRKQDDAAQARLIGDAIHPLSVSAAFEKLDAAKVPVEIVDPEFSRRLHDDAEFSQRRWTVSYPHPVVGKLDQIGLLFDLSDTPGVIQGRPLLVGEHTKEILGGLGYDEEQIKTMEEQMAIGFAGMPRMPPRPAAAQAGAPKPGMASLLEKEAKK
ncbi:crotonobetainyl-CoA:carnitine CoA-transferase CaiB-like acyl-CoA transferase [Panacagrimonas perspica]|uniref:Crotonobetainyl-CoA:carnitine CoA-transferase CaiB-like acyl-CoA transferase n=1 Tax=Panacagrimonas perspica TaxID=381431 RepID=A0A4R7PB40_9GAMM|nr:CoA transferase [Panacagrimonas perspica]TDU31284.1 crotonobetainyl-CoA:carnitine CoA-transferase CaiB-like acyl-CoA transferase [Panacagrimonas perspica]